VTLRDLIAAAFFFAIVLGFVVYGLLRPLTL